MIDYEKVTFVEYQEKKKEILDSLCRTDGVCSGVNCNNCPLGYYNNGFKVGCPDLEQDKPLEALKIIMDCEIPVDWSKVLIDTKVLVKNNTYDKWRKRHFAKYEDGRVYCWHDGKTSFTSDATIKKIGWNFAKLTDKEIQNGCLCNVDGEHSQEL